jgi:hypothetical protein
MMMRVVQRAVVAASAALVLAGCSRQVARESSNSMDSLAIGPDRGSLPVPSPAVAEALDATGGLTAWTQTRKLHFEAVVAAYYPDGSSYLTEHDFIVCPWTSAIRISGREPQMELMFRIAEGRYRLLKGDPDKDVSPLSARYRDYAEAVLRATTAPVRMLDDNVSLLPRPLPVMIDGQWYHLIEAKFRAGTILSKDKGKEEPITIEPYWTDGIYFQNQSGSRVDMIWLADPAAQKFLLVRGYDYAQIAHESVLIPTRMEVFQSDAEASQGRRLALVDLEQ